VYSSRLVPSKPRGVTSASRGVARVLSDQYSSSISSRSDAAPPTLQAAASHITLGAIQSPIRVGLTGGVLHLEQLVGDRGGYRPFDGIVIGTVGRSELISSRMDVVTDAVHQGGALHPGSESSVDRGLGERVGRQ
jgi:hypothetical protein